MKTSILAVTALIGLSIGTPAAASDAPGWFKFVHWISGNTDRTDVPIMMMGAHMQMNRATPSRGDDPERASAIIAAARDVLRRYPTVAAAERAGYKPFNQTGQMGEEIHYTSIGYAYAEGRRVDYAHPGSILYQRTPKGIIPVGVMYSAPGTAAAAALDAAAPLSVATWHRHVDFCWATGPRERENEGPRFGYSGSIHDQATCRAAQGYWLPLAFGWMTHVYPNRAKPWGGEEMDPGMTGMHH